MLDPLEGKARLAVLESTRRANLYEGSVRSGKTVSSLVAWLRYTRTGPAGNLAMIGRTERTLKRNIIDPLVEWLGPKRCKYTQGTGEIMLLGRRVYVAGADNEAAVTKIQGLTLAGAYVDECTTIPESFWAMLMSRLSIEGAQVFGTMNPAGPSHWMMRDWLKKAAVHVPHDGKVVRRDDPEALDLARFSFNLRDNPHLPKAYVDALGVEYTGLWRLRFIEGLWVAAEGAIYDTLDETRHLVAAEPDPAEVRQWLVAVDYGTTNPFHALLLAVTDERVHVMREWRWDSRAEGRQRTDSEYSAALAEWLDELRRTDLPLIQLSKTVVDPSAASFIAQLWRDSWPAVTGANNTVADGIRITSSLLASGRLVIHPSCSELWDELLGYVWDPKAVEKGIEQPLKVADHGPDALRYGIMALRAFWRHWIIAPVDTDQPDAA